jgi:hypothetical protein
MKEEGRLVKSATGDNTDFSINFVPKMSSESLLAGYRSILDTIYSPKHYYARVKKFLKEYRPVRVRGPRYRLSHFNAAIKSVFRLGIIGKERIHYWKLIIWSLFRKPRLISHAITLSIYGFHFRKVFSNHEKTLRMAKNHIAPPC